MSIVFGSGGATQQYGGVGSSGQTWQTVSRNNNTWYQNTTCLLYTSPSPRDRTRSRMPSSA